MLVTGVLAFAVAVVLTPLVTVALRRWNVLDTPNARSSHHDPTPRGGGVAVAVAVIGVAFFAPQLRGATRVGVIVAGTAFGLVGLLEDVVGIPALRRLPLLFAAAVLPLPWLLYGLTGGLVWRLCFTILVVMWLVSYVNAYNFMDGINGISAGQAVVAGLVWYLVGEYRDITQLAVLGVIIAGAALGFAPYNFPSARIFLGDVGSYFLGALLAYCAVLGLRAGLPLEVVLAPLAVYVADTGMTIVRRVRRGERWYQPHREHTYQRLTTHLGNSHTRTTPVVVAAMAGCAALGCVSLVGAQPLRVVADVALVALIAGYLAGPSLLARSHGGRAAFT